MLVMNWTILLLISFICLLLPLVKKIKPWKSLIFHSLSFFLFFAVTFLSFNLQVTTDSGIVAYEGDIYFRIIPFALAIVSAMFLGRDVMGVLRNANRGF